MKSDNGILRSCRCCKPCTNCTRHFQKIAELKGLIIYRHVIDPGDMCRGHFDIGSNENNFFIIQNTNNVEITSADYLPELEEKSIMCCEQCRQIFEQALKLLKRVPVIDKHSVNGICDYCSMKQQSCLKCQDAVNKFFARSDENRDNIKEGMNLWLSKVKKIFNDAFISKLDHYECETDKEFIRARSEISIDQIFRNNPKKRFRELDIRDLLPRRQGLPVTSKEKFKSDTELSMYKGSQVMPKKEHYVVIKELPPVPYPSQVDVPESQRNLDRPVSKSYPTIADDKSYKDDFMSTYIPGQSQYDIGKINRLYDTTQSDYNIKRKTTTRKPEKAEQRERAFFEQEYEQDKFKGRISNIDQKQVKEALSKKTALLKESHPEILQRNFSFKFPQETKKKKTKRHKSSTELIKDTKEMLEIRAEGKKQKIEEARRKKAENEENKRQAREEKEKIIAELKRQEKREEKPDKGKVETQEKLKPKPKEKPAHEPKEKIKPEPQDQLKPKEVATPEPTHVPKHKYKEKPKLDKQKPQKEQSPLEPKGKPDSIKTKDGKETDKEIEKRRREMEKKEKEDRLAREKEAKRIEKEEKDTLKLAKDKEDKLKDKMEQTKKSKQELDLKEKEAKKEKSFQDKPPKDDLKSTKVEGLKPDKPKANEVLKVTMVKGEFFGAPKTPVGKQEQIISLSQCKLRTDSVDDLVLQLVRMKQGQPLNKFRDSLQGKNVMDLMTIEQIKAHKHGHKKTLHCAMCVCSDLELDFEDDHKEKEIEDIIVGKEIIKFKPSLVKHSDEGYKGVVPILFQSNVNTELDKTEVQLPPTKEEEAVPSPPPPVKSKQAKPVAVDPEASKGVIRYALSDRSFIDKGWTMLPTEKVVRKMNVYRMRPAHPEFDWFKHNKNKRLMHYDTGERLAEFDDNGRGRWYYRNGRLALDYYDCEEMNAQQRFVIYSNGEPDERNRFRPFTVLGTFDYLGNGIVFDHTGKIRLKYNQTEGVLLDRSIGPVSHWKWHTLNDPPVLQQVMIDTQMPHKDPTILKYSEADSKTPKPDNDDMLAIEFDNFIKEKSKKLTQSFKPFQIKTKALKINEHFSLRVLDQATVYLIYRDGTTNLKLNIGMILDHKEIVDTETAEVGEVSHNMEKFPAVTDSLAELQRGVAQAQRMGRIRAQHERQMRRPEPTASVDKLMAAASRPMRLPLRTVPTGSTTTGSSCKCNRKPNPNNVYCNNLL